MEEQEMLSRFEGIQRQLARERRARLHAWIPRALVIAAFAVFAVIWAQGLDLANRQEQDRETTAEYACIAINDNRDTIRELIVAVRDASEDPESVQVFLDQFDDDLAQLDCSKPFDPEDPAFNIDTTTTSGG